MFDATKSKYPSISFQKLDIDDPGSSGLRQKYHQSAVPFIVMLDGSDKVLYAEAGAPGDQASFEGMINNYK